MRLNLSLKASLNNLRLDIGAACNNTVLMQCYLELRRNQTWLVMFTTTLLGFVVLCLFILYFNYRRNYVYWKERGIPYEKPTVFIGNLGHFMRISTFDYMLKLSKKFKNKECCGIFLGQQPALVINSKELAKKVLVKDFDHFQNRYSCQADKDDPLGRLNLFSIRNPLWSLMKHELAPMFTTLRLKLATELMNENSSALVQRVQTDYVENKKSIDLKELCLMYTTDTIGFMVFGLRVSTLKDLTSPVWFITQHMVKWTFWRGFEFTIMYFVPALAKFLRLKLFSAGATEYLNRLFLEVIDQRKKLTQHNDKDLLNHLMKLKENFKLPEKQQDHTGATVLADDLILAQVAMFIIASVETSASALSYCLHELAHHPEKQEKLYQEISTALERTGKSILDYNDLMELTYLTGCIKETMRKYPGLPVLDRQCNKTYQLTEELTIEEGTPVIINIPAIHYNEEYYPTPEEWRPERFVGANDNDNHNFTFLTMGEGPRVCIGKRYGYMQVRTAIAQFVTKFWVEPDAPYALKSDPYSLPVTTNGVKVKFIPRN